MTIRCAEKDSTIAGIFQDSKLLRHDRCEEMTQLFISNADMERNRVARLARKRKAEQRKIQRAKVEDPKKT